MSLHIYIYLRVDRKSFVRKRLFSANKKLSLANLSRSLKPMLSNCSFEESFMYCQSLWLTSSKP